jgi:hypothetical protein
MVQTSVGFHVLGGLLVVAYVIGKERRRKAHTHTQKKMM